MKKTTIIRLIMSLALVYGVFTETGVWTAVSIFLMFVKAEVIAILFKKLLEDVK